MNTHVNESTLPKSPSIQFGKQLKLTLHPKGKTANNDQISGKETRQVKDGVYQISNVTEPEITVILPSKKIATGKAIIICPGGGYQFLSIDLEGTDVAAYWASKGVAAIVLKNRLPSPRMPGEDHKNPYRDAQRAIRVVRYYAKDWNIDPKSIGIQGFSAGGHLASTVSTKFDFGNPDSEDPIEQQSCRPDFSILVYPVITFCQGFAAVGSKGALIGCNPKEDLAKRYSSELHVNAETPPTILIHSADDESVMFQNSIAYYEALQKRDVESELIIYSYGGHGYGLATGKGRLGTWPDRCYDWIQGL